MPYEMSVAARAVRASKVLDHLRASGWSVHDCLTAISDMLAGLSLTGPALQKEVERCLRMTLERVQGN